MILHFNCSSNSSSNTNKASGIGSPGNCYRNTSCGIRFVCLLSSTPEYLVGTEKKSSLKTLISSVGFTDCWRKFLFEFPFEVMPKWLVANQSFFSDETISIRGGKLERSMPVYGRISWLCAMPTGCARHRAVQALCDDIKVSENRYNFQP